MKRPLILFSLPFFMISCASASQQVQAPDTASYKAVEITAKSNSDRIVKLETELNGAKEEIESLRIQNRQLADSYDSLVEIVKEHRSLTMTLISKLNSVIGTDGDEGGNEKSE